MDFSSKIELIENARINYITFENAFREYTSSGNSINGAYNFFSIEDIEYHKELTIKTIELEAWKTLHGGYKDSSPVLLSEHSIIAKLEKLDESISNNT